MSKQRLTNWNPLDERRGYVPLEGLNHVAPRLRHMADDNGNHDDDNGARHDHGKQIFGRESTPNFLFCLIVATNTITNPQLLGKRHHYLTFCLIHTPTS